MKAKILYTLVLAIALFLTFSAPAAAEGEPEGASVAPKAPGGSADISPLVGHGLPLATIMFERKPIPLRIHTVRVTGAIGCDVKQGVLDCKLNLPRPPTKK